jgi:hypothetical protein
MRHRIAVVLALLALWLVTAGVASCSGAYLGVGPGDRYYNPYYDDFGLGYYYDGLWRGDYVFYHGDWYYRGYGTPYIRFP